MLEFDKYTGVLWDPIREERWSISMLSINAFDGSQLRLTPSGPFNLTIPPYFPCQSVSCLPEIPRNIIHRFPEDVISERNEYGGTQAHQMSMNQILVLECHQGPLQQSQNSSYTGT
jgi:hypothetical protein